MSQGTATDVLGVQLSQWRPAAAAQAKIGERYPAQLHREQRAAPLRGKSLVWWSDDDAEVPELDRRFAGSDELVGVQVSGEHKPAHSAAADIAISACKVAGDRSLDAVVECRYPEECFAESDPDRRSSAHECFFAGLVYADDRLAEPFNRDGWAVRKRPGVGHGRVTIPTLRKECSCATRTAGEQVMSRRLDMAWQVRMGTSVTVHVSRSVTAERLDRARFLRDWLSRSARRGAVGDDEACSHLPTRGESV